IMLIVTLVTIKNAIPCLTAVWAFTIPILPAIVRCFLPLFTFHFWIYFFAHFTHAFLRGRKTNNLPSVFSMTKPHRHDRQLHRLPSQIACPVRCSYDFLPTAKD